MESWSRLSLNSRSGNDAGPANLFVSQDDIQDAFYRMGIPAEMSRYFALPEVQPDLLADALGGQLPPSVEALVASGLRVFPAMVVLPMGFSWAFHWCHMAHVAIATKALPETPLVQDWRPPPDLHEKPALLVYADNADHLGLSASQVDGNRLELSAALNSQGLLTHDVAPGACQGSSLGICFDGELGTITTTPERDHTLD